MKVIDPLTRYGSTVAPMKFELSLGNEDCESGQRVCMFSSDANGCIGVIGLLATVFAL